MTHAQTSSDPVYEIRFRGHLSQRYAHWFDSLTMTAQPDGDTLLTGPLPDQSALHGILSHIRDLGLELISVKRISE